MVASEKRDSLQRTIIKDALGNRVIGVCDKELRNKVRKWGIISVTMPETSQGK